MLTRGYPWRDILESPYYGAATMVAKIWTVAATLIWGALVLYDKDSLAVSYSGQILLEWGPGRAWGTGAVVAGLVGIYRILRRSRPNWITWVLYGAMMTGWLFIAYFLIQVRPFMPAAVATLPLIALLSIIAFLASPRR